MKKIIVIVSFLISFCGFAQIKLKGNVTSVSSPIANVNIVLLDQNNKVFIGMVTKEDGLFEFSIPQGSYTLAVNNINYDSYEKKIIVENDLTLEPVVLFDKVTVLGEVIIKNPVNIIRRKLDKIIFSVQDSPSASMGNAFDALQKSPGLIVKNDEIAMLGKSGVKVMVEGKIINLSGDDLKSYLAALPASDIKEIEIISNPSSKYEAEGNSGMVNIIFKKLKKNSWSNTISASHIQAKYGRESLNNNFSYRKNKVNLSLSVGYDFGKTHVDQRIDIFFKDAPYNLKSIHKENADNFYTRFLFDYDIDDKNKIGIQYSGAFLKSDLIDNINARTLNQSNDLAYYTKGVGNIDEDKNNHSFNLFYENKLDTLGKKITYNFDYLKYDRGLDSDLLSNKYDPNNEFLNIDFANTSNVKQSINNYNFKIDVEHPSDFANFQYGTKISFLDTNNIIKNVNLLDPDSTLNPSDNFIYKENIQALYGNGTKKINEKLEFQFGLRGEYTEIKSESKALNQVNKNNYFKLFPTIFLSYQKNDKNLFIFNYGRRIQRPNYSMLNPFRYFINSTVSSEGNPNLQPSYINSFEVSHTYNKILNTKLSFTTKKNAFESVFYIDETTQEQIIRPENFYNNTSVSLTENYQLTLFPWWKIDNTLFLNYSVSKKTDPKFNAILRDGFEFYGSINNFFTLSKSKNVMGEANFWYDSPYNDNLNKYSQSASLDLALSYKSVFKNFNLSVGLFDVFNSIPRKMFSNINNVNQNYIAYRSNRYFRISLTYVFGNDKISTNDRNFGNEAERNRSN